MNPVTALRRRGMLGALALLGGAGKGLAAAAAQPVAGEVLRGIHGIAESAPPSSDGVEAKERDRRWNLYQLLQREQRRAERRRWLEQNLLGGWPPGLDSMHSNARWFRASLAARRIEAQEEDERTRNDSLMERILVKGLMR